MRILGIDPGIARTGWGLVETQKQVLTAKGFGCIETSLKLPLEKRLEELYAQILQVIEEYQPDAMVVEQLFFNTNAKTALVVGQARGVVLLAAAQKKLVFSEYTPLEVKIAVAGYGRADKGQVGMMVKTLLKLTSVPKPDDTADALAIALTHAFSMKMNALQ